MLQLVTYFIKPTAQILLVFILFHRAEFVTVEVLVKVVWRVYYDEVKGVVGNKIYAIVEVAVDEGVDYAVFFYVPYAGNVLP